MPAAATDASAPAGRRSTISTRRPRSASSRAQARPMMPPPMTRTSGWVMPSPPHAHRFAESAVEGFEGRCDLRVAVGGREEHGLVGGGRQVDAALQEEVENAGEEGAVGRGDVVHVAEGAVGEE